MTKAKTWVITRRAYEQLGIDRDTLFQYRDDGTLKLGPHYAAFPETRSRSSFRWNVKKVRQALEEQGKLIPACRSCNENKASLKMEDWYLNQKFFNEDQLLKIKEWIDQDMTSSFGYNSYLPKISFAAS